MDPVGVGGEGEHRSGLVRSAARQALIGVGAAVVVSLIGAFIAVQVR